MNTTNDFICNPKLSQTEAAVLIDLGKPLQIIKLDVPSLRHGQVMVKMAYSGICHTQLLEVRGQRGPDRYLPHLLGHEGSGTIIEVGPGVKKVRKNDRVVVSWIKGNGLDASSSIYGHPKGSVQCGAVGTFVRHAITCESRVTPIPDAMPLREASLLGCAVLTGSGIVNHVAEIKQESTVAIFGVGGIGLCVLLAARIKKPRMLIAVDLVREKLSKARELGATHLINAHDEHPLEGIMRLTQGIGADFVVEATGNRGSMEKAFRSAKNFGGLCIIAGNLAHGERISIDPYDLIKGKRIVGTWGGEAKPDADIPQYIDLFLKGELKLDALISHEYSFHEINQALNDLEQGRVIRAIVKF